MSIRFEAAGYRFSEKVSFPLRPVSAVSRERALQIADLTVAPLVALPGAEMRQQGLELQPLEFDSRGKAEVACRKAGTFLALVHERERIPVPVPFRQQRPLERVPGLLAQKLDRSHGQRAEGRVLAHASKPVLRVRVVRLPSVHDGVDEVAIRIFETLHDAVGGFQVIVPQERRSPDQVCLACRQSQLANQIVEGSRQTDSRLNMGPNGGTQAGRLRGVK